MPKIIYSFILSFVIKRGDEGDSYLWPEVEVWYAECYMLLVIVRRIVGPCGRVSRWIFGTRACTMRFTGSHVPRGRVPSYWVSRSQRRLKSLVWLHEFLKRSFKPLHYQLAKNVLSNCNCKIHWNSSKRLISRVTLEYYVVKEKERCTERKESVCCEFNCKPIAERSQCENWL